MFDSSTQRDLQLLHVLLLVKFNGGIKERRELSPEREMDVVWDWCCWVLAGNRCGTGGGTARGEGLGCTSAHFGDGSPLSRGQPCVCDSGRRFPAGNWATLPSATLVRKVLHGIWERKGLEALSFKHVNLYCALELFQCSSVPSAFRGSYFVYKHCTGSDQTESWNQNGRVERTL